MVIEYASGGELFDHILAHRYLKEREACRLFAQLISGVSYMHKRNVVHRDLKLENLLLDRNRNIIITDFGFANQFSSSLNDLMATSCGSPCYAAPELVVSDGMYIGTAVDIWSCGVILYAMLCGYLPFDDDPENPDGNNINLLYRYILSTRLVFPDYVSPDARDLLRRMLVPDPMKRCDMRVIMNHRWLFPYAYIFEDSGDKEKGRGHGHGHGQEQDSMEPGSPGFTETARPPKRHTIQVEYDQAPAHNRSSPEMTEVQLNNIVEADEEENNDTMVYSKPSDSIHFTSRNTASKPKSHSRIRPTTIHFSQLSPQLPVDSPSVIMTYGEPNGEFTDRTSQSINTKDFNFLIASPLPLSALNSQTRLNERLYIHEKKGDISHRDNTHDSNPSKSMSSNAAKKVMDWFRKKSLIRQQHTFETPMSHPRKNHSRVSHEFRLQYHNGAIDNAAVTSKTPLELMSEIKTLLEELGIEIKNEYEWKLKCIRKKKTHNDTLKSKDSVISNGTQVTSTLSTVSTNSQKRCTVGMFSRFLKFGNQASSYPVHFERCASGEPIYGEKIVDSGGEIHFVVEICKLKELGKLYIVDVTRRKGNLWSYKFIYHTILDRLNLKDDRFSKESIPITIY
ncbi:hypothetical protein K7432_005949 [Basidiobolus ranarum]